MKYHIINKNDRNVYRELKEYTFEELKNHFKPNEELDDCIEKWENINDMFDLIWYLEWEAYGDEVEYMFEEICD